MKPLRIILLVGTYPKVSETFIIRKAIGLKKSGLHVLIMARSKGELDLLNSYPRESLPEVEYFIKDSGPFSFLQIGNILFKSMLMIFEMPGGFINLLLRLRDINCLKLKQVLRFLPFISKKEFAVIHAEFLGLGVLYSKLIKIYPQVKYAVSCRGADVHLLPFKSSYEYLATIEFLSKVNLIHCVSTEMESTIKGHCNFSINTLVNRPAVLLETMSSQSNDNSCPVLISVGRLEWKKGFDYLLRTYEMLRNRGIIFEAIIVGGGSLSNELQFSIADLGLCDCVRLLGSVNPPEVSKLIKQSDIFVLSSVEEGISNAVLEAMSNGLPVISTACGGMSEVIDHNINGVLIPIRDPKAIADAIVGLLSSKELMKTMGNEAKRTIRSEFNIDRQIKVFEKAYNELASK